MNIVDVKFNQIDNRLVFQTKVNIGGKLWVVNFNGPKPQAVLQTEINHEVFQTALTKFLNSKPVSKKRKS